MKQNASTTLEVKIKFPFDEVKRLEFVFKSELKPYAKTLIHKVLTGQIPVKETSQDGFVIELFLSARETMALPEGKVYMDTRIILADGTSPETEVEEIEVNPTLFSEVYDDGDGNGKS